MRQVAVNRQTMKMRSFADKFSRETPHALFTEPLTMRSNLNRMNTWAELYNLGNAHKKQGDTNQALACYYSAINIRPDFPEAHNNIANILALDDRNFDHAIQHYNFAIDIKPHYYEALHNLAVVYEKLGAYDRAISICLRALALKPKSPETLNSLGNYFEKSGQTDKAITAYETAIQLKPDYCDALNNLGNSLKMLGRLDDAIVNYQSAIDIRPGDATFRYNLGIALFENKVPKAAQKILKISINLAPEHADAHNAFANCCRALDELDTAILSYEQAIQLRPDHGVYHFNLANCLKDQGNLHEAIITYETAIKLDPDNPEFRNNLGIALKDLCQFEEAEKSFDQAIRLKPNSAEAYFNKSTALLKSGRLAEGWKLHEWRWQRRDHQQALFKTFKPNWTPGNKDRVLVWCEQGLGDQIMFASMLPQFAQLSAQLTIATDKRLIPLFERSFDARISYVETPEEVDEDNYDSQISIGSLAQYIRNDEEDFTTASSGFLKPDPERVKHIRALLLAGSPDEVIGISWRSSSQTTGSLRSIDLKTFIRPLMKPGRRFVNLQYGDTRDEIADACQHLNLDMVDLADVDNQQDIEGLAATICACDKVVSTTNATVHLAGALNKEIHVLLPFANDWRWQGKRADSYWYSSVRLYRKAYTGDWNDTLQAIAKKING